MVLFKLPYFKIYHLFTNKKSFDEKCCVSSFYSYNLHDLVVKYLDTIFMYITLCPLKEYSVILTTSFYGINQKI